MSDYQEVVRLWKNSGLALRPADDLDDIKLKLERDPDLFLVAIEDSKILGSVMGAWDGRRGWINHLAVMSNRQRDGIGRSLIVELEVRLIKRGCKKVNAQIYNWNKNSIQFFKALGYQVHADLIMIGKRLNK